jgi:ribonucleoside-diphosphate reductase alpha chain
MSTFSDTILTHKYINKELGETSWDDVAKRVAWEVVGKLYPKAYLPIYELIRDKKFIPGGRYLYAAGRQYHQTQNCLLLTVEDSRQAWADLMRRVVEGLSTGAGIGIVYSKIRANGSPIKGMGGTATGPISLMQMVNEVGRHIQQGGSRRSALWAGLHWNHPDIFEFISLKDWIPEVRALKEQDFNFPATMDGTNISVILDDDFFAAYNDINNPKYGLAQDVYWRVVKRMLKTGEPGFSVDTGINTGENLRNACTEVTSRDDNDICNLGSINMSRVDTLDEFAKIVDYATLFLLCGTIYSKLPFDEVAITREKNRRLGLGLMGIHEWLLVRGKRYGSDPELAEWLKVYATSTDIAAKYADELHISRPVKTRAIAPTGTLSIIAETTAGIEPIFCAAFKRRYLKGDTWHYQYVVDATAQRIIDRGVKPEAIEDAYSLANDVERRVEFQHFVQRYVDHSISSTINLPSWGSEFNHAGSVERFGDMLMQYLPGLRGITTYPDGARGGQPLTAVSYYEAKNNTGTEFIEYGNESACVSGVCGI